LSLSTRFLDPILLDTPPIALEQCYKEVAHMTRLCRENITAAFTSFIDKDLEGAEEIEKREDEIDDFQTKITGYLVELSRRQLSKNESSTVPRLIHCINDAERVGDHAENLVELTQLMLDRKLTASLEAKRDLHNYFSLVDRQFQAVIHALIHKEADSISDALELEEHPSLLFVVRLVRHKCRLVCPLYLY